jgi:hypothetical protein
MMESISTNKIRLASSSRLQIEIAVRAGDFLNTLDFIIDLPGSETQLSILWAG